MAFGMEARSFTLESVLLARVHVVVPSCKPHPHHEVEQSHHAYIVPQTPILGLELRMSMSLSLLGNPGSVQNLPEFVLEVDILSFLDFLVGELNELDLVRAQGTHGWRGFLLGFMNGFLNGFFVFHDCSVDLLGCELGPSTSIHSIVSDPVFVKCCHGVFVRLVHSQNSTLLDC